MTQFIHELDSQWMNLLFLCVILALRSQEDGTEVNGVHLVQI